MLSAAASAPVPARSWRNVTTAITLTMPATMIVLSTMRTATYPSASPSLCRLTTGKSATAVPIPQIAVKISRNAPNAICVS